MERLGWIDDAGEWHPFPPLPEWAPEPIQPGERILVWIASLKRYRSRKAVPDPTPLFRGDTVA